MKPNKNDKDGRAKELGDLSVISFEDSMKGHGIQVERTPFSEDVYDHIDYWITREKKISVDLKSLKRISRSDAKPQNKKIWVEFKNVQGKDGWILGKADYICLEQPFHFLFVKREDLLDFCRKCVKNEKVSSAKDAEYKLYTRRGRKDVISIVDLADIIGNCSSIFMLSK